MSLLSKLLPEISFNDICSKMKKYGLMLLSTIMKIIGIVGILIEILGFLTALIPVFIYLIFLFEYISVKCFGNSVPNNINEASMKDLYLFSVFVIIATMIVSKIFVKLMPHIHSNN
jgi:hypothetical protein